jgi:hypothetical protein
MKEIITYLKEIITYLNLYPIQIKKYFCTEKKKKRSRIVDKEKLATRGLMFHLMVIIFIFFIF